MGAQFLELLKKVTVFMLAGQLIVHFLPAGGYEKYVKMMISIMVLSQIVLPILSLGKFDAAGVYDSAMDKYEQEIEKIGMQVEADDFEGRDYQEEALSMTVRQKLEPLMEQYGLSDTGSDTMKTSETEKDDGDGSYTQEVENRLEALLSSMDGVGEVKVMVTLSSSMEQVVE